MLALEGLKVLDLSNYVPGALCTMILADMGAEVIKVEPAQPFPYEDMGFSSKGEDKRRSSAFFTVNRNKKSIGVNLRVESGQKIFYSMVKDADVIVEGYRPGVVKRLGIDYETVNKMNPRIIYCSLSGYGQDGPYRLYPGHDINYISHAGIIGLIGPKEGPPYVPLNLIADFAGTSLYGAIGILLAVLARQKTGKGQFIDHTYVEGSLHQMTWFTQRFFQDGSVIKRGESWVCGSHPYYSVYKTKDGGYITIGCIEPHFWENLCRAIGKEEYIQYPWNMEMMYSKPDPKCEEMREGLQKVFLTKTRDEWFDQLIGKDICIGKVYSLDEVFTDPQMIHRQMVVEIDDPKVGKVKQIGVMPKLSDTPGQIRNLSPLHGDHTDEIMLSLGYDKQEIEDFKKQGIIG